MDIPKQDAFNEVYLYEGEMGGIPGPLRAIPDC